MSISFPPEVWGPFFWHTIHIVALGYPSQNPSYSEKKAAKEFFESLQHLIPCPVCRTHYIKHLETYPITPHLDRRRDLFTWTVTLHNAVNITLSKPTLTVPQVMEYYKRLGARGLSPILKPADFVEADTKALIQGIGIGVVTTASLAGLFYYLNQQ